MSKYLLFFMLNFSCNAFAMENNNSIEEKKLKKDKLHQESYKLSYVADGDDIQDLAAVTSNKMRLNRCLICLSYLCLPCGKCYELICKKK